MDAIGDANSNNSNRTLPSNKLNLTQLDFDLFAFSEAVAPSVVNLSDYDLTQS